MGKQIAKLGIRPEDLKDKTVTSEQLEKTKGGKAAGSEECVCYCGCYTDDCRFQLVVKRLGLIPALYDAL